MIRAELWARGEAQLGEGPRVVRVGDVPRPRWVDLLGGTVFERGADGESIVVARYPGETVSALLPLEDDATAIALRRTISVERDGRAVALVEPGLPAGLRFSDGIAGPSGHLWIGTVGDDGAAMPGALLRVGGDGVTTAREGVGFSNGLGFSADGDRLFLVDSTARTITAHAHRDGEIDAGRVVFRLPDGPSAMDGLAVDEYDRLWVAMFGAGRVLAIATTGSHAGEVVEHIEVPARRVTSCAFDDDLLLITTARVEASADELAREPLAGSVFAAGIGCGGAPTYEGSTLR